ncbi:MAG: Ala-tRNA(Pro) hydrolase [Anaerolineaceae bacterium]|nr:Ala-tRNA(Pro) hydrolase [Anaerolineaceae bacterium]
MTETLYETNSYLKTIETIITQTDPDKHAVSLQKTIFYPGGGGQPNDTGWLTFGGQQLEVSKVQKIGGEVWHFLHPQPPLPEIGTRVTDEINWERRYQLMRTHSAMHVLCGVVFRDYGALVTGGNMEPLEGRMDFEFESLTKDLVQVIEDAVNKEIQQGRNIKVNILPRDEAFLIPDLIRTKINLLPPQIQEIRTIEIEGLDLQADGGTHVNNIQEIGPVKITNYKSKGKINKRIYLSLTA